MIIRPVRPADAAAICGIYNHYIEHTVITFEEELLSGADMARRVESIAADYPYLVYEESGAVLAYAYVNKWKERAAYKFSVEDSIYIHKDHTGRGIGKRLLAALLDEVKKTDIHAVVAGITIPNEASVGLHLQFGFTEIARFKEIGYKQNRWLDVGYWELVLP